MITIVKPGLLTTIQDSGRWGYQANGMPVAGAMDRYAYRIANILVGNSEAAAAIEMTMFGGTYHFDADTWIAICGADMQATLNSEKVSNWSSLFVPAGSTLTFDYAVLGCRAYLAIQGGIDVPEVLGSRSTYTRGHIGGLEGRALRAGDVISPLIRTSEKINPGTLPAKWIPQYDSDVSVRVLLGPQDDHFTGKGIATLFDSPYVISDEADRMGYRLEGPKIEHCSKPDIISDALCLGSIQVPGHGMPIVMMADRQTTGGYAKIGTVIGPDLGKLAQAYPGNSIRFIFCTDDEAVAAFWEEQEIYKQIAGWAANRHIVPGSAKEYNIYVNGLSYNVLVEEVE